MQKQTQLTKREVVLLVIAGILLITYTSIHFLISPMMHDYSRSMNKNEDLKWKKQEALTYPSSIKSDKIILSKLKNELLDKSAYFDDKADSLKVDEEITTLLQSNGIAPVSVLIENGIRIEKGKAITNNEGNQTKDSDVEKKEGTLPGVYKYTVNVQSMGSLANAQKVLDTVSKSTNTRIVKFDVSESEKTILNFTFIVYVRDSYDVYELDY